MPTTSRSLPAHRPERERPMRPKPLMPTCDRHRASPPCRSARNVSGARPELVRCGPARRREPWISHGTSSERRRSFDTLGGDVRGGSGMASRARRRVSRSRVRFVAGRCGGHRRGARICCAGRRDVQAAHPVASGRLAVAGARRRRWRSCATGAACPTCAPRASATPSSALGFAHAQDRLAQLVWLRRAARGPAGGGGRARTPSRATARRACSASPGSREREAAQPRPATRALLEAYAAGVNAGSRALRADARRAARRLRSPTSAARGALARPRTPSPSRSSTPGASAGPSTRALVLSDLIQQLGGFDAAIFFPRAGASARSSGAGRARRPRRRAPRARGRGGRERSPRCAAPRARRRERREQRLGGRRRAHAGAAGRCSPPTPTSSRRVPAPFYAAHLEGGELDVAGAGTAGRAGLLDRLHAARRLGLGAGAAPWSPTSTWRRSSQRTRAATHDGERLAPAASGARTIAVRGGEAESLVVPPRATGRS